MGDQQKNVKDDAYCTAYLRSKILVELVRAAIPELPALQPTAKATTTHFSVLSCTDN